MAFFKGDVRVLSEHLSTRVFEGNGFKETELNISASWHVLEGDGFLVAEKTKTIK